MFYSNKLPIAVTIIDYSIIALSVTVGTAVTVTIGVAVSVVASFFTLCNSFELALLD